MRWTRATALALVLITGLLVSPSRSQVKDPAVYQQLIDWVKENGGTVKAEIKLNKNGVRGLFVTEYIPEGEHFVSVPAATIINAGSSTDSFAVPTLTVLRELKSNCSRFQPYLNIFPAPNELLNSCNMDRRYIPMWKSPYWEANVKSWQDYLEQLHTGVLNPDIEVTVQESVGNVPVSLDDLRYACALSSSRYVSAARRKRLIMAPIFDMANHDRNCVHTINAYEESDFLHVIAGADMKPGDEVCYSYGQIRDDYAVAHYGFLPPLEDPPRLSLVDHREFKEEETYSHDTPPSEEPFDGTPEELRAELARLQGIVTRLVQAPDEVDRLPGDDPTWDLLKALEGRRLNALEYEIKRIKGLLKDRSEL